MLSPRKVKHRKQFKGRMRGEAYRGSDLAFGDFALKAVGCGRMTAQQIEAARIAMTRHVKRGGKIWINIFPDRPLTKKALGLRMGSGKGPVETWVANVKPGRIMFEMGGVSEELAQEAMSRAMHKLPMKTRFVAREEAE